MSEQTAIHVLSLNGQYSFAVLETLLSCSNLCNIFYFLDFLKQLNLKCRKVRSTDPQLECEMKGLTKFKSQAAAAVLGSSFTRSNFQSEGFSCHPGVLALWPKITLRMKEKGCRDISYDACVTSNPNTPPQLVAIHYQLTQKDLA